MKLVVQRSKESSVTVDKKIVGKINFGLVVLVGFTHNDTLDDIKFLAKKHMMNKSILDVNGSILSISQFTLYADTKKGNRPSYVNAMKASEARKMYDLFNDELKKYNINIQTGIFQTDMLVNITNDGPVTIILEN